ncbi:MAG: hypothetical protein NT163_06635 [Chlorobiales bacterium]|nr:hypothetical protein [Chlorobiales bacterium]
MRYSENATKAYHEAYPSSLKWKDSVVWVKASALAKNVKALVKRDIDELKKKLALELDISENQNHFFETTNS